MQGQKGSVFIAIELLYLFFHYAVSLWIRLSGGIRIKRQKQNRTKIYLVHVSLAPLTVLAVSWWIITQYSYLLTYSHIKKKMSIKQLIPWNEKIVSLSIKKRINSSVPFGFRTGLWKPPTIRSFFISVLGREGMKFKKINWDKSWFG